METNIILQGDALNKLKELPEKSINMCMTSPPYWALRDYGTANWEGGDVNCAHLAPPKNNYSRKVEKGDSFHGGKNFPIEIYKEICKKCGAKRVDKQLGLEPTFEEYINNLCNIFDGVKRVLRDDGTCWVNIGDTYNSHSTGKGNVGGIEGKRKNKEDNKANTKKDFGLIPDKTLVMIPFRFTIEMVNRGWILRNTIIWHKPNCMPSSVKDRFTVDFEYVFFFVKNKKYWFEQQFEKHQAPEMTKRTAKGGDGSGELGSSVRFGNMEQGRNKRTVWSICPRPFKEAHFAVYPEELCETPIKAGCPKFVCKKCGNPKILEIENITNASDRRKKAKQKLDEDIKNNKVKLIAPQERPNNPVSPYEDLLREYCQREGMEVGEKHVKGHQPTCKCNAGFTGGIVLDPFFGAGTTGLVALKQNKKFIGIELNQDYIEIASERLKPFLEQVRLKEFA